MSVCMHSCTSVCRGSVQKEGVCVILLWKSFKVSCTTPKSDRKQSDKRPGEAEPLLIMKLPSFFY